MRNWVERWNTYWFPSSSTLDLARCRIIAVAVHLALFLPYFVPLGQQIGFLENNPTFIKPQLLIQVLTTVVPRNIIFTPQNFTLFYFGIVIAGSLALVGFWTRTSLFLLALGTWILIAHKYSYGDVHHPEAPFAIFLLLLAFAPSGERLSIDALLRRRDLPPPSSPFAIWPLKAIHLLLALTYFSTGVTKLLSGGLEWINGYTLQSYTLQDAVRNNMPLGLWLAPKYELAVALSVFTLFFELFFFVSLLLPRTAPFFFIAGVFFHAGLYATGEHGFFPHITLLVLLLLFLNPGWDRIAFRKRRTRDLPRPALER